MVDPGILTMDAILAPFSFAYSIVSMVSAVSPLCETAITMSFLPISSIYESDSYDLKYIVFTLDIFLR